MKNPHSLIIVVLCVIFVACFSSCRKDDKENEPSQYEVYAPNAEGVYLTQSFFRDEPNIEKTYLWISNNAVLWWSSNYNSWPKSVFVGQPDYFKYYVLSLKNVEPFIDCYKIVGGSDNHVIEDEIHPTKQAILDYINRNILYYSPFFDRGLNFNNFQNKERSGGGRLLLFALTLTSQGFCFCPPQN